MKVAGLPLELEVRFLNLIEWDLDRAPRRNLDFKRLVREPGERTFEASLTFDGTSDRDANFLPDDTLEIARPAEFALNTGRTHFKSVGIAWNSVLLVEQVPEAFRNELTVAVRNSTGLIYIHAQKTRLTCAAKLNFDNFDAGTCGGAVPQFGQFGEKFGLFDRGHDSG